MNTHINQAIITKYHGPGNVRGARISATTASGIRHTIGYPHELSTSEGHHRAAQELADKLGWRGTLIGGGMKEGFCWVLVAIAREG